MWAGVVLMTAVLCLLGFLQYRWSLEISEATTARMQTSLDESMMNWRQAFYRELARAAQPWERTRNAGDDRWKESLQRFQEWNKTASHPELVSDVFLWRWSSNSDADVLRLNKEKYQWEAAD